MVYESLRKNTDILERFIINWIKRSLKHVSKSQSVKVNLYDTFLNDARSMEYNCISTSSYTGI